MSRKNVCNRGGNAQNLRTQTYLDKECENQFEARDKV